MPHFQLEFSWAGLCPDPHHWSLSLLSLSRTSSCWTIDNGLTQQLQSQSWSVYPQSSLCSNQDTWSSLQLLGLLLFLPHPISHASHPLWYLLHPSRCLLHLFHLFIPSTFTPGQIFIWAFIHLFKNNYCIALEFQVLWEMPIRVLGHSRCCRGTGCRMAGEEVGALPGRLVQLQPERQWCLLVRWLPWRWGDVGRLGL